MAKLSAPNPNIFTTDPIEQVLAKGVTNRDNTAGLSASWLLAFGNDRAENQDKYIGALDRANAGDAQLARAEMAMKLREQGMKSATDLIKEGFMPSTMRAGSDLFPDPTQGDVVSKMLQDLIKSKIAANYNKGAGGAGKESTTVETTMMPWGAPGPSKVTSKGGNPANAFANNKAAMDKFIANPNYSDEQKKQVIQQLMFNSNRTQPGIED